MLAQPASAGPDCFAPDKTLVTGLEDGLLPAVVAKGVPPHRASLEERMRLLKIPAVSVAYIHDGRIAWARAFGVAGPDGRCATPDTLFQAASISKPVSAMAILRLAQTGQIDLDVGVNRYLRSWRVPANPYSGPDGPTLRQILSHTAGFTVHGFLGYAAGEPVPTTARILDGAKPANSPAIVVDTRPGTVWRYSGGGYVVAQQLVEDVTGKPFADFMRDTVLGPVGMAHSTYRQPIPPELAQMTATPVDDSGEPVAGGPHTYPEDAPAGLWTTPSDLARYAIAVQDALAGRSSKVISQPMAREMLKPGGLGDWGLGPSLGGSAEHPYFTHGGANAGYQSNLTAYDQGDGVVIMTDGDNGWALNDQIVRTLAYENGWPDFRPVERVAARIEARALDAYPGKFRIGRYFILTVERSGDQLVSRVSGHSDVSGQSDQQLLASSASEWFYLDDGDARITFQFDGQGRVTGLVLHRWNLDLAAARLSEADAGRIASELAAKVKSQAQTPGSEAALRRLLDEIRAGTPRYDLMSGALAQALRRRLAAYRSVLAEEGELKSLVFTGVAPDGADVYKATFAKGALVFRIILTEDGRIDNTAIGPG